MNRKLATAIGSVASVALLSGCGGGKATSFRPMAFGENNACYYVDSPSEVFDLQREGLCDRNWGMRRAPDSWLYRYSNYYYSPAYVNHYVPAQHRSVIIRQGTDFQRVHSADIARAQSSASYVSVTKKGKTAPVPAKSVAKVVSSGKFGGGDARTFKNAGGNSRICCGGSGARKSGSTFRSSSSRR